VLDFDVDYKCLLSSDLIRNVQNLFISVGVMVFYGVVVVCDVNDDVDFCLVV